jgi:hypothetical protein
MYWQYYNLFMSSYTLSNATELPEDNGLRQKAAELAHRVGFPLEKVFVYAGEIIGIVSSPL